MALLLAALKTETDNKNREMLMWASVIYLYENIADKV